MADIFQKMLPYNSYGRKRDIFWRDSVEVCDHIEPGEVLDLDVVYTPKEIETVIMTVHMSLTK